MSPASTVRLAGILTWLYVPAPRAVDLLSKAAGAADGVVIDLEDAVHPRQRPEAREQLAAALEAQPVSVPVVVRINPAGSSDFADDVAILTPLIEAGLVAAVRLPKTDSVTDVETARSATADWGDGPRLICQLESALAVANAFEIAAADGVHSIMLGEADLRADLLLPRGPSGDPGLGLARQTCVLASRAAGRPSPVGSAFTDVTDTEGLQQTSESLAALGFVGRSCIHPRQVATVRQAFGPSSQDVTWALQVLEEAGSQQTSGGAASVLTDGSFVDPAIVRQAREIVAAAPSIG